MTTRRLVLRLGQLLLVLIGLSVVLVGPTASPASAICEGDITPVQPGSGPLGLSVDPPASPPKGDPLTDKKAPWLQTYGPSTKWNTYDLGCGPDMANHPTSKPFTAEANLFMDQALLPVVISEELTNWVTGDPFGFLDPMIVGIQHKVEHNVFAQLMPLALLGLGAWFVWKSRSAMAHETATTAIGAVLIVGGAVFLLQWPERANNAFQDVLQTGVDVAQSPFGQPDFSDAMFDDVVYPHWLAGEVGSPDSDVARKYGPDLYRSQHLTYAEVAEARAAQAEADSHEQGPNNPTDGSDNADTSCGTNQAQCDQQDDGGLPPLDPGDSGCGVNQAQCDQTAMDDLIDEKRELFKDTAEKVESEDPAAYDVLTGRDGADNRPGLALEATVYLWCTSAFYIISQFMLGLAMLVVRAAIIAFPLLAPLAIFPKFRPKLASLLDLVAAALVGGFKFMFAAGLYSTIAQGILSSPQAMLLKVILLVVIAVVGLLLLRPIRTLKTFVPGADPNHSYLAAALKRTLDFAVTSSAVETGIAAANDNKQTQKAEPAAPAPSRRLAEEETMPGLEPMYRPSRGVPLRPTTVFAERVDRDDYSPAPGPMPALGAAPSLDPALAGAPSRVRAISASGVPDYTGTSLTSGPRHRAEPSTPPGMVTVAFDEDAPIFRASEGLEVNRSSQPAPADLVVDGDGREVFVLFRTSDDRRAADEGLVGAGASGGDR